MSKTATAPPPSPVEQAERELRRIEAAREGVLKQRRKAQERAAAAAVQLGEIAELETEAALGERDPEEVAALRDETAASEREANEDVRRIDEHVLPGIDRRLEAAQQGIRLARLDELWERIGQGGRERLAVSAAFADAKAELDKQAGLLVAARAQVEADERQAATLAQAAGVEPPLAPDEPEWGDEWKQVSLRAFGYLANPEMVREFVSALELGAEQARLVELLLTGPVRPQAAAAAETERRQEASQQVSVQARWAAEQMILGFPGAIERIPEGDREEARRLAEQLLGMRRAQELSAAAASPAPTVDEVNAAGLAEIAELGREEQERNRARAAAWDAEFAERDAAREQAQIDAEARRRVAVAARQAELEAGDSDEPEAAPGPQQAS